MLSWTPEQWLEYRDCLDREGVPAPETAADTERDAAVVAMLERIVKDPASKAAAQAAAAALRARNGGRATGPGDAGDGVRGRVVEGRVQAQRIP